MRRAARCFPVFAALFLIALTGCPAKEAPPAPPKTKTVDRKSAEQPPADTQAVTERTAGAGSAQDAKPGKVVDPVAANGKIFEDWPAPQLALVLTGEQDGYVEPCGCQGRENQFGGIARRFTFLKELAAKGWPTVAVDDGGLVNRFGRQAEIKFQITVDAMNSMGYAATGFGPKDLRLPAETLAAAAAGEDSRFVSANVNLFDLTQSFRVVEIAGQKIGVTSILGDKYQAEINNDQVTLTPAQESLTRVLPKLQAADCDLLILLAHATPEESTALAEQFPAFDVVVTAGGAEEPPHQLPKVTGKKSLVVEVGHKGKYAIVLGKYDDPQTPWRYQRVPLDARFADAPEMQKLMAAYQDQLEQLGLTELGIRPKTHPRSSQAGDVAGQFVGAAKCGECHPTAFGIWSKTKHAKATDSLAHASPPRLHDPECLSCHVTGWSPQEYLPYDSGFLSMEATPQLAGNGCENCHGPGGAHVAAEAGKDLVLREQQRQAQRLTKATVELNLCVKCHDGDNDPHFAGHFDAYWPKVEHKGKK